MMILNAYKRIASAGRPRKPKAEPGHIPRPKNSYFCFLKDPLTRQRVIDANIPFDAYSHTTYVRAVGTLWKRLSEDEKAPFKKQAKEEVQKLYVTHPDYKYHPRQSSSRPRQPSKLQPLLPLPARSNTVQLAPPLQWHDAQQHESQQLYSQLLEIDTMDPDALGALLSGASESNPAHLSGSLLMREAFPNVFPNGMDATSWFPRLMPNIPTPTPPQDPQSHT